MNIRLLVPALALSLPLLSIPPTLTPTVAADEAADTAAHEELVRRRTAVALNYCRAALHRIRRHPGKQILIEEQQRILNNLDLNQIEDPEVITLYKAVLDEISQVEISDRERFVIDEQFRRGVHRKLGTDFFVIGAQVATGQLGSVIQTGANSWWDYRNQEVRRDSDHWKVEKGQLSALMSRSSTFLDSFWKLSRKNEIPDRWLVRDQDLDQLGHVLSENNPERRLRMLTRMERFMECYPPYWYYLARTQQQLGLLDDAAATYQRLTELGSGHFRQDDMLASSMANLALIQEMNGDPEAARTAARGLDFSLRNWESNLVCAWVLGRHKEYDTAEDLILCNLDERLEESQSTIALVSLYFHSEDRPKLGRLLNDPQVVHNVPVPGLLLCSRLLGSEQVPQSVTAYLASTLSASVRRDSRRETLTLAAAPAWKLNDASPRVTYGNDADLQTIGFRPGPNAVFADFAVQGRESTEVSSEQSLRLTLNYPGTPAIHITLNSNEPTNSAPTTVPSVTSPIRPPGQLSLFTDNRVVFQIREVEMEGVRISLQPDTTAVLPEELREPTREVSIETEPARS
jgi:hypothetical protein